MIHFGRPRSTTTWLVFAGMLVTLACTTARSDKDPIEVANASGASAEPPAFRVFYGEARDSSVLQAWFMRVGGNPNVLAVYRPAGPYSIVLAGGSDWRTSYPHGGGPYSGSLALLSSESRPNLRLRDGCSLKIPIPPATCRGTPSGSGLNAQTRRLDG